MLLCALMNQIISKNSINKSVSNLDKISALLKIQSLDSSNKIKTKVFIHYFTGHLVVKF
jgi:hypothetical protein